MSGRLAGRIALVTGASSGIGEATALALAAEGASVAVSARRVDRLADLAARIEAVGVGALAIGSDVADEASAVAAVTQTLERFGRLDILVNSAGIIQAGGVENSDSDEYRRVVEVNLLGTFYSCKAAIPAMRAQGGGDIINISSTAAYRVASVFNSYGASKHALRAMTEGMRQEVGGYGIRVSSVLPGATSTEVAENVSDPKFREFMKAHVGKEGALAPSDIADAVIFAATMPARANVTEITVRPTIDMTP